eukprot:GSChrysophyteH1.ASY1.ANO1.2060.1 assembled CDS
MSHFSNVELAPPNNVLGLAQEAKADNYPQKIDLTIGAYRDEKGKPLVLPSVRRAEEQIQKAQVNHEYLHQDGLASFNSASQILLFGHGTGCLTLALKFIKEQISADATVYLPSVTWANHAPLCAAAGLKTATYAYLDAAGVGLDFDSMLADISRVPEGSVLLLHAIAHNPTGVDPTTDEWDQVREVVKSRRLLVLFDNAYQGFVSGDPHADAYAVRSFANDGLEMFVACSYSKNFGLYGERAGCLHVVLADVQLCATVASQMRVISRSIYSTCPAFGALVVSTILNDPEMNAMWLDDTKMMATRIAEVREALYAKLVELNEEFHVYMLGNGRVSLAGLNQGNVAYFCESLKAIIGTN